MRERLNAAAATMCVHSLFLPAVHPCVTQAAGPTANLASAESSAKASAKMAEASPTVCSVHEFVAYGTLPLKRGGTNRKKSGLETHYKAAKESDSKETKKHLLERLNTRQAESQGQARGLQVELDVVYSSSPEAVGRNRTWEQEEQRRRPSVAIPVAVLLKKKPRLPGFLGPVARKGTVTLVLPPYWAAD